MAITTTQPVTWDLFRDSGQPRSTTSIRADVVTAVLGVWFALGMFVDAWAHSNLAKLETFFTPWHAVFYSGFAATAGWILWLVWGQVREGRRGLAAIPLGYGAAVLALPIFAVSGAGDLLWHTLLGIETTTDVFFSPSHLGLVVSMVLILTSPLHAAWARHSAGTRPPVRALMPAVLPLAFAVSLVLLFLSYASPLRDSPIHVVLALSEEDNDQVQLLAAGVLVTGQLLVAPLLLLARRWYLPPGSALAVFGAAALITATVLGFEQLESVWAVLAAGVLTEVLALVLRPTGDRRWAFWTFGALAPLVTWTTYLLVSAAAMGGFAATAPESGPLPSGGPLPEGADVAGPFMAPQVSLAPLVPEFWTGLPVVAALLGWALAALMLPNALPRELALRQPDRA